MEAGGKIESVFDGATENGTDKKGKSYGDTKISVVGSGGHGGVMFAETGLIRRDVCDDCVCSGDVSVGESDKHICRELNGEVLWESCDDKQSDELPKMRHDENGFPARDIRDGPEERARKDGEEGDEAVDEAREDGSALRIATGGIEDEPRANGDGEGDGGDEKKHGNEEVAQDAGGARGGGSRGISGIGVQQGRGLRLTGDVVLAHHVGCGGRGSGKRTR